MPHGTKCHTTYVARATSWALDGLPLKSQVSCLLLSHVSCYLVTRYYFYFCVVKYNKYNMGFGENWTVDMVLSGGCYRFILSHCGGHGSNGYFPFFHYLFRRSRPTLILEPGACLSPWSGVCTGYTHPIRALWQSSFQLTY